MRKVLTGGVLGLGLAFGLAACGVEEELDKADRKAFQRTCDGLGIARDTPSYDQCMIEQQSQLAAEERENARAVQEQEAIDKQTKALKKQNKKLAKELAEVDAY